MPQTQVPARRVLLVDDEVAILLTLKAILEINGFAVDTAANAREAKHKIKLNEYAMVITDMRMESDASGLAVVKAAKAARYAPAVAVLTAFPEGDVDYYGDGADELLVKPMNVQLLVNQMEAMLVAHEDKKRKPMAMAAAAAIKAQLQPKVKKPARKIATKLARA
jgi:DNA-binding response OmpR family regulator